MATYGSGIDPRYVALWVENPFSQLSARTSYQLDDASFHTSPKEQGIFSRHNFIFSIILQLSCNAHTIYTIVIGYIIFNNNIIIRKTNDNDIVNCNGVGGRIQIIASIAQIPGYFEHQRTC